MQKYLLPIGFYDLLYSEALINQESIDILLKNFYNFGYNLVKTPLVEFEDSLGGNKKLGEESFKMIDIFSGKNLVIRSDITAQIIRLLNTKLQKEIKPLRICYAGDVLKVKNDDLYSDRQLTQVGIELIGSESSAANEEVINVILDGLNNIKLPNLIIDFCLPQFLDSLLSELKIKDYDKLKSAIAEKNISAIRKLGGKFVENIINLTLQIGDFKVVEKELKLLPISQKNINKINNLQKIISNISKNYPDVKLLVNIFGDADFLYHEEIGFTIFEEGFSYPIARGGRYLINDEIPAVGATIYINNLRKILVKTPKRVKKIILLPSNCGREEIAKIQSKGYITISSLEEKLSQKQLLNWGKELGCNFVYIDGEIVSV